MESELIILTYGTSRAGKTSFINTAAKANLAQVGSSNNESTTISVNFYEVDLTSLPRNPTSARIIDVPGYNDSKLRMTPNEIMQKITETIVGLSDTDKFAAILIFESLSNDPSQLRQTLENVQFMLGPEFRRSAIVILTKADNVANPQNLAGAKKTAEGICRENNVPFFYLQNNHSTFTLSESQWNEQFDLLMDNVKSISPYLLREVQHYQNKIIELAKYLELTLPKNKKNVQIDYETQELKSEMVPVQKSRIIYEVQEKRRGGVPGLLGAKKSFVTSRSESYVENEIRYHTEQVTRTMNQEMELEYDASHYLNMAREQILKEIRYQYRKN